MLTVGVLGSGASARSHVRAYVRHPQVREVFAVGAGPEAGAGLAREFGIIKGVRADLAELLADESIGLIDICTTPAEHAVQVLDALRAGKDVIVDTPLALSLADCDEMIAMGEETGRRLFCVFPQRRFPAHLKAMDLLQRGEIGAPLLGAIMVLSNDPVGPDAPGPLFGAGYHAVTMLQRFLGPAIAVSATQSRPQDDSAAPAETTLLSLELPSGTLGSVIVCNAAAGDRPSQERRLVGADGSLLIRDNPEDEMPLIIFHGADLTPVRVHNPPDVAEYATRETVAHFVDCLLEQREPDMTLQEARSAVAVILAAKQSAQEGRRVAL